jgi:hypothetical protein
MSHGDVQRRDEEVPVGVGQKADSHRNDTAGIRPEKIKPNIAP